MIASPQRLERTFTPTPRQIEVLQAVVRHDGDLRAAGEKLFVSCYTARRHLQNLREATGCHSLAELILWAIKRGYVSAGE